MMVDLDEKSYEKSMRLPTFDGTDDQFQIFSWMRFKAYTKVYTFAYVLMIGGKATLPATDATVIDTTMPSGKLQDEAKKRNEIAIVNFMMAFTNEGTISLLA
jgi:glucan biosynthesis protein